MKPVTNLDTGWRSLESQLGHAQRMLDEIVETVDDHERGIFDVAEMCQRIRDLAEDHYR